MRLAAGERGCPQARKTQASVKQAVSQAKQNESQIASALAVAQVRVWPQAKEAVPQAKEAEKKITSAPAQAKKADASVKQAVPQAKEAEKALTGSGGGFDFGSLFSSASEPKEAAKKADAKVRLTFGDPADSRSLPGWALGACAWRPGKAQQRSSKYPEECLLVDARQFLLMEKQVQTRLPAHKADGSIHTPPLRVKLKQAQCSTARAHAGRALQAHLVWSPVQHACARVAGFQVQHACAGEAGHPTGQGGGEEDHQRTCAGQEGRRQREAGGPSGQGGREEADQLPWLRLRQPVQLGFRAQGGRQEGRRQGAACTPFKLPVISQCAGHARLSYICSHLEADQAAGQRSSSHDISKPVALPATQRTLWPRRHHDKG